MSASPLSFESTVLVVVDVETTGLYQFLGDRICEIGIVQARGEQILETYQTLVNPQRPISPGAFAVNRLSDEELQHAPVFANIADQVYGYLNEAYIVCHNASFDLGFLDAEFSRLERCWQPAGVIDTLEIARRYFKFGSNSLPNLAARLGIQTPQAHRALSDALTTHQVLCKLLFQLRSQDIYSLSALIFDHHKPSYAIDLSNLPPALREAIMGKSPIEIVYVDGDGNETYRLVTPQRIVAVSEIKYLVAYCHLRDEERTFRLDRIMTYVF